MMAVGKQRDHIPIEAEAETADLMADHITMDRTIADRTTEDPTQEDHVTMLEVIIHTAMLI